MYICVYFSPIFNVGQTKFLKRLEKPIYQATYAFFPVDLRLLFILLPIHIHSFIPPSRYPYEVRNVEKTKGCGKGVVINVIVILKIDDSFIQCQKGISNIILDDG